MSANGGATEERDMIDTPLPVIQTKPTSCEGCGACCMEMNMLPLAGHCMDGTLGSIPDDLRVELEKIWNSPRRGSGWEPCVWLDRASGKCRHYEYRPEICKEEVELGDDGCMRWRSRYIGIQPNVEYVQMALDRISGLNPEAADTPF